MRREDRSDLAVLAAIAEAGSFTKAAAGLGVPPSAVSHAMRALEARLGVRLVNRAARSAAPTGSGERLLAALRPAMSDVAGTLHRPQPNASGRWPSRRTTSTRRWTPRSRGSASPA